MRKITIFLMAVVVACSAAMAADVDFAAAQNAARSFMTKQVANGRLKAAAASNLKLAKAEASVFNPKAVDYYIFNADKSYVVVAGDDQAPEILMYGEEGTIDMDNIPPAMQWLLNKYKYQIDGLKAGTLKANSYNPKATTAVPPMVTANWDQSAPYNNQCPTSGSRRAVTGCPATSLAMCYYKWKWPTTFPACAAINGNTSGGFSVDALPERAADWANIIDEYTGPTNTSYNTTQANAVAWLMRYAGQTIPDYMYGTSASGADDPEIYQGVLNMGYTNAQYLLLTQLVKSGWSYTNGPQQYTDAQWNNYMMTELQAGRPIEYLAYDYSGYQLSGHAFNVFGCDSNGKYYVNWGWSGDSNGYCALHNFTTATGATGQSGSYVFNYGEAMIIGIEPPAGAMGPELNINNISSITLLPGKTSIIPITGSNLTNDVIVTLTDPNNAFTLSVDGVNQTLNATPKSSGSITIPAASINDKTVNVRLTAKSGIEGNFTGSLSFASQGADTKTVSLMATSDEGGTASDAYLNIAKYATIDAAGWRNGYFDELYKYTENTNEGVAWLTLPVYGAWASWYYNKSSGTGNGSGPQRWISSSISSQTNNINGNETWNASSPFVGSSFYFTSNNPPAKYFGNTNGQANSTRTITFYVTNASAVMMFGKNNYTGTGNMSSSRRCFMEITQVDENLNQIQDITTQYGTTVKTGTINLSYSNLDPEKIYRVILSTQNTHLYEIAFATPLPSLTAEPTSLSFFAQPGETATKSLTVKGMKLSGDITATVSDANGAFSAPTTIHEEDAEATNGATVDVTFTAPETVGAYTGTLTLVSGDLTATVQLNGQSGVPEGYSRVTLTAGDVWGDGSGYQMLLDADHNTYGTIIPEQGGLTTSGNATAATYAEFEYKIPENADGSLTTTNIVFNNSVTILIPAGTYDWCITNPSPGDRVWIASSAGNVGGRQDDFEFEEGKNYEFIVSLDGTGDRVDVNPISIPTNLTADPGCTTADITWTPGENNESWNLRYRPYVEATMETIVWDFPVTNGTSVATEGWSSIDNDEDGYDWGLMATDDTGTDACWYSQSFINDVGALTPDNWLVSPEVQLGGSLKFKAWRSQYEGEVLGVFVYQDGNEYLIQAGQDIRPTATETEYEFDLSDFEGTGFIVIAHYNCTDGFYVFVDDIELTYPVTQLPEWIYVNDVTSPYTITGLTPETTYEVQVQGVNDFATSAWTPSTIFTTLAPESKTLAKIESEGTPGTTYAIADSYLVAVACAIDNDDVYLWCKDVDRSNAYVNVPTDFIDFMKDDQGAQTGDWDQSNWVALKLTGGTATDMLEKAMSAVDRGCHKITGVIGVYKDNVNFTMEVPYTSFTVSDAVDFTPNVYCVANFNPANLGENGVTVNGKTYFFMTPKVQEVCTVTYAQWNRYNFIVPVTSGFQGTLNIDYKYNDASQLTVETALNGRLDGLEEAAYPTYTFTSIVQVPTASGAPALKAAGNGYIVNPTNLTAATTPQDPVTAIYTVGMSKEVKSVKYYNPAGIESSKPFQGVNIVVTRYSDGSVTTTKVVK